MIHGAVMPRTSSAGPLPWYRNVSQSTCLRPFHSQHLAGVPPILKSLLAEVWLIMVNYGWIMVSNARAILSVLYDLLLTSKRTCDSVTCFCNLFRDEHLGKPQSLTKTSAQQMILGSPKRRRQAKISIQYHLPESLDLFWPKRMLTWRTHPLSNDALHQVTVWTALVCCLAMQCANCKNNSLLGCSCP